MVSAAEDVTAGVLVIGDEILSGRTHDKNIAQVASWLQVQGIRLAEVRVVPDIEARIIAAVNALREAYDYLFTTGGIGPTHDDITAECVAKAFNVPLVRDEQAFRMLEEHYGLEQLTPPRAKMSLVPEGAKLIPNPVSAAPGFNIDNVYVMAGVPRIMQAMLDHVMGTIVAGKPILSNTVACGLAESILAEDLSHLATEHTDIQIGSYPHYRGGVLGLSLVLRGMTAESLDVATQKLIALIRKHGEEPRALSIKSRPDSAGL
jgi:molybdenum cofactor synthesis domain-containing protein